MDGLLALYTEADIRPIVLYRCLHLCRKYLVQNWRFIVDNLFTSMHVEKCIKHETTFIKTQHYILTLISLLYGNLVVVSFTTVCQWIDWKINQQSTHSLVQTLHYKQIQTIIFQDTLFNFFPRGFSMIIGKPYRCPRIDRYWPLSYQVFITAGWTDATML